MWSNLKSNETESVRFTFFFFKLKSHEVTEALLSTNNPNTDQLDNFCPAINTKNNPYRPICCMYGE